MICNSCKKDKKQGKLLRLYDYKDNSNDGNPVVCAALFFCLPCWIKIKNLDGVPMMFKGKVKQILKDWELNELFN